MFSLLPCLTDSRIHLFSGSYGSIIYLSCHRNFHKLFSPRHKTVAINSDKMLLAQLLKSFNYVLNDYHTSAHCCAVQSMWSDI